MRVCFFYGAYIEKIRYIVRITSLCLLVVLLLLFTSCGHKAEVSAENLIYTLESYFGDELHACKYTYKKSASEFSRNYLSTALAGIIYYGEKRESMWELDISADYAVRLSDDESGCEIHIFKLRASSDTDSLEKMLRRRLEYLQQRSVYIYTPENYEKYISGAEVHVYKNYVFLLATPDNEKAYNVLKDRIGP